MPIIDFHGKKAIQNYEPPYHILEEIPELNYQSPIQGNSTDNILIEGDNLLALKSLLPEYEGKIKCIYIDPPYNTNNKDWVYCDNIEITSKNDPAWQQVEKFLKDGNEVDYNDQSRHSKWLCMMYPRLKLLHRLLKDDGVIFVSIDDNEVHHLRMIMDEIWGETSFVTTIHVQMSAVQGQKVGSAKKGNVVKNGESILVYSKDGHKNIAKKIMYDPSDYDTHYTLFLNEDYSITQLTDILIKDDKLFKQLKLHDLAKEKNGKREMAGKSLSKAYRIISDVKDFIDINSSKIARMHDSVEVEAEISSNLNQGEFLYHSSKTRSYILTIDTNGECKQLITLEEKIGSCDDYYQTYGVRNLRGDWWSGFYLDMGNINKQGGVIYSNGKKPVRLIRQLIEMVCFDDKNSIILDSFGGSGTTAHAILQLNKQDKGKRKSILIQMIEKEKNICKDITRERLINSINSEEINSKISYYRIGTPLFTKKGGDIVSTVTWEQLAPYIYFTEFKTPLIDKASIVKPKVGSKDKTELYLLYKEPQTNTLTEDLIIELNKQSKAKKVIYADKLEFGLDADFLKDNGIIFKQIPYDVLSI